jgi:hypothetical protein
MMKSDEAKAWLSANAFQCHDAELIRQVRAGNKAVVEALLDAGVSPNAKNSAGESAVVVAARAGVPELAEFLVSRGADLAGIATLRPSTKTWVDKLATLAPFIAAAGTVLIAFVGFYFARTYDDRQRQVENHLKEEQTRLVQMDLVVKMVPHLAGTEPTKKAALLSLSKVAGEDFAIDMARLMGGEGAESALSQLATGPNAEVAGKANLALQRLRVESRAVNSLVGNDATGKPPIEKSSPQSLSQRQAFTFETASVPSGARKEFGNWVELCGHVPPSLKIIDVAFRLEGDRSCGAWAECAETRRTQTEACWHFRTQGHDEVADSGIRMSRGILTLIGE